MGFNSGFKGLRSFGSVTVCQFSPVLCVLGAPYGAPNTHKTGLN